MKMPKLPTLASRLKYARKTARLTQKQLADSIGVSQAIISQLETGQYDKTVYVAQLAHFCHVPAQWLATGQNVDDSSTFAKIAVEKITDIENNQALPIKGWSEIAGGVVEAVRYQYKYVGDAMAGQAGRTSRQGRS